MFNTRRGLIVALCLLSISFPGVVSSDDAAVILREDKRLDAFWTELFGKDVDLSAPEVRFSIRGISPKPEKRRFSLKASAIDPTVLKWSRRCIRELWFEKSWVPDDAELTPDWIALRDLSIRADESNLYYKWKKKDVVFRLCQSSNGVLVEVESSRFDFERGVPSKEVSSFLQDVFHFPVYKDAGSPDQYMKMPSQLKNGDVFGSLQQPGQFIHFRYHPLASTGFITENKLFLILFLSNRFVGGVGPRNEPRHVGFAPYSNGAFQNEKWLDACVYEADGKTLVSDSKIRGER